METTSSPAAKATPTELPKTPKGLDLAADLVKQVITLSTAVTAFTATFAKNFAPEVAGSTVVPGSLRYSWIAFVVAILFGIITLMTIVGIVNRIEKGEASPGAIAPNVRVFGGLTMVGFFAGLVLTIIAGISILH